MKLIVVHYHLRPGGIRRVIEQGTPQLIAHSGLPIDEVVLAAGEMADASWHANFAALMGDVPVAQFVESSFGYFSEQRGSVANLRRRVARGCERLLAGLGAKDAVVWAHNLGIARNLLLSEELAKACARRGITLVAHHHDWWFDNRWIRWPEMQRCGVRQVSAAAHSVFPSNDVIRHVAINQTDAKILQRHFKRRSDWMPNLTDRAEVPSRRSVAAARAWLDRTQRLRGAPAWIVPCRLLRRKNVAEALLLTRWLRPDGYLVTTGAASSGDELPYFERIQSAAREHRWPLRLGVLAGDESRKPGVGELLRACETVLLTSIQEGFGLPFIEAAAAERPLIARRLPIIAPDLDRFGFGFPNLYTDVLVPPTLFSAKQERARQIRAFSQWRRQLPPAARRVVGVPAMIDRSNGTPVPFSRLTLTAQLEVLSKPARDSWRECATLNPWLQQWSLRAARGALPKLRWPRGADDWLGGRAYGERFGKIVQRTYRTRSTASASEAAQLDFIKQRLDETHLFPLLWSRDS